LCTCTARDAQYALSKKQNRIEISEEKNLKQREEKEKQRKEKKTKKEKKKNGGPRGCPPLRCRYKLTKRKKE